MKSFQKKVKQYLHHPYLILALGLIPCFLVITIYFRNARKLEELQTHVFYLKEKQLSAQKKSFLEQALLKQIKNADPAYLEKEIESLRFLQTEVHKIQALLHTEPNNESLQHRLNFLLEGQNHLRFRLQNFQRAGKFQEIQAIQEHPVELNREDLKKLLARIENVPIGEYKPGLHPPDLIIKNFELIRKPLPSNEEVFLIHLELIKREILHD